jgi:hypothetical protein
MQLNRDPAPEAIRLMAEARQLRILTRRNLAQSHEHQAYARRSQRDFAKLIRDLRQEPTRVYRLGNRSD